MTLDPSIDELMGAVGVYRGELLPGFYDEWVILERRRLLAIFDQRMALLLRALRQQRRWTDVLAWSEHWDRRRGYARIGLLCTDDRTPRPGKCCPRHGNLSTVRPIHVRTIGYGTFTRDHDPAGKRSSARVMHSIHPQRFQATTWGPPRWIAGLPGAIAESRPIPTRLPELDAALSVGSTSCCLERNSPAGYFHIRQGQVTHGVLKRSRRSSLP